VAEMTEYAPSPEAAAIAKTLIGEHHTHLADVEILYLLRYPTQKSKGQLVLGRASKASALLRHGFAIPPDFVIELAGDEWKAMSHRTRVALVDHELSHCKAAWSDNELTLSLVGHDFEDFAGIVERHGAWSEGLERAQEALQGELFDRTTGEVKLEVVK
jgi:predicted metallopeptidase